MYKNVKKQCKIYEYFAMLMPKIQNDHNSIILTVKDIRL